MTAQQLRDRFLEYFEKHGHVRRPSASLVPDNDPTVLLTTAGMQPFKPYFLGDKDAKTELGATRATSVQKCFRTSDIESVGDESHLTFFEMLGNFSFGDYSKIEAIDFAWDFLTKEMHLPAERLWATIFAGDEGVSRDTEAEKAWLKYLPPTRIIACGKEDNFWGPPGKTGPCGPCSEIHWQETEEPDGQPNNGKFMEIWNLVFMEYRKDKDGKIEPLPNKNVDTGMGLERLSMAVNREKNIFATDSYSPIINAISEIPSFGSSGDEAEDEKRKRIVADHIRGAVFLLADGVEFSNKDQGYILRRLVRRAADQFINSDFDITPVVDKIAVLFMRVYPEVHEQQEQIKEKINAEIEQYRKVLSVDVNAVLKKIRRKEDDAEETGASHLKISPEEAFQLYATHGISIDRLNRLQFEFDRPAVERLIAEHQEVSRAGAKKKFGGHGLNSAAELTAEEKQKITRLHTATHLLHAALRKILGSEVGQQGSDINPLRLRFDFSFPRKLTDEEKLSVEQLVNDKIAADLPVSFKEMPYQGAIDSGAIAFFKEKYPETVKVYSIGDFSKELCGGPHVEHTGEIGRFKITAEQSVGSGVRRIKGEVV